MKTSSAIFTCTIPGRPIVKKNTQRVIRRGGRTFAIYSTKYRSWEKNAIAACNCAFNSNLQSCLDMPLIADFKFYFKNRQGEPDVSNLVEGPADMLKKAGVIKDDSLFQIVKAQKFFNQEPRTEIELFKFEEGA